VKRYDPVDTLPNKRQARQLVLSIPGFWGCWAIAVGAALLHRGVVVGIAGVACLTSGFAFFAVLLSAQIPSNTRSSWLDAYVFNPDARKARNRALLRPMQPKWIAHTLKETGWYPVLVGSGLSILLLSDLVLLIAIFSRARGK
jgi:hypothetical protein